MDHGLVCILSADMAGEIEKTIHGMVVAFFIGLLVSIVLLISAHLLIKCCDYTKQGSIQCFLCKDEVSVLTWDSHRGTCASENDWFIQQLPKSRVRQGW